MTLFLASLAHDDLAPATLRGYRYDLRHFLAWQRAVQDRAFAIEGLAEYELIAYRQHMVAGGLRPATVNRRLDALRRLCRWARGTGALSADAAGNVRPMRTTRNRQPVGLTDIEIHALLRAAGASSHGLAARNYALVQLILQAGLRVGDVSMNDRSGSVRIRQGKGLKSRDVPLNATGRRALKQHLDQRGAPGKTAALFTSIRETAMPVRTMQAVIASVARRARLTRVPVLHACPSRRIRCATRLRSATCATTRESCWSWPACSATSSSTRRPFTRDSPAMTSRPTWSARI